MIKITALALFSFATVALADDTKSPSAATPSASMPPASTKTDVTFATDIKPIFDASCVKCHTGDKPKAGLRLDTLENALKGGKGGKDKILTPGDSANSPVVKMISHIGDQDGWMPPAHNRANIGPLTADQVGLVRAWIDQGAK